MDSINNETVAYLSRVNEIRNKYAIYAARVCDPPVVGEITKRKVQLRKLSQKVQGNKWWIEQDGVRISPIVDGYTPLFESFRELVSADIPDGIMEEEMKRLQKKWDNGE